MCVAMRSVVRPLPRKSSRSLRAISAILGFFTEAQTQYPRSGHRPRLRRTGQRIVGQCLLLMEEQPSQRHSARQSLTLSGLGPDSYTGPLPTRRGSTVSPVFSWIAYTRVENSHPLRLHDLIICL